MATDKPYSTGIFETIVDVHFGSIYLVVVASGANGSTSFGPYGPSPSVGPPSVDVAGNRNIKGLKLLDTFRPSSTNFSVPPGFSDCFIYTNSFAVDVAWVGYNNHTLVGGQFAATDNACPWPGGGPIPPTLAVAPINYFAATEVTKWYLFSVPAADAVAVADISELIATSDTGLDPSTFSQITTQGTGLVKALVYSRVKGKVTKLKQLIDFSGDGKPRPTEDDACLLGLTDSNEGTFNVNVHLDSNKDHAQVDNYGKMFQPYKATITPSAGSVDQIPSQPPPRLRG